MKIGESFWTQH